MAKLLEAAFPCDFGQDNWQSGMSKRELFAAMAMQGLISELSTARQHDIYSEEIAAAAVAYADALLKKLGE